MFVRTLFCKYLKSERTVLEKSLACSIPSNSSFLLSMILLPWEIDARRTRLERNFVIVAQIWRELGTD